MHQPSVSDYKALKRLLRYIQGTIHYGLPLQPNSLQLTAYSDADWAGDTQDRRSITGFCIFLGKSLISWCVKKQVTVAKSSTEAEYRALSSATSDIIWLRRLLADFHIPQTEPTSLYCDNTSALALAHNPVFHARTKHIEIDYHFIRQHISSGAILLHHLSSEDQPADLLTKPLSLARFTELRNKLSIQPLNPQLEGGC
ncbi:Retrovirus-related Pol polyprotein from transposon TNT 1-94 [Dendrobium catenatum]|uniref:Retrovirus-related Pol polyprotein from transposon TNT 1-94 n=1 Tax=Dendrobium catenatum TaxID=906689 RepID=A0A2I0VE93_9ASPA|nr:Retrovirus-related Pol polyprotein from transposon TNT 1-94 [Dendrobium catenatum]